MEDAIIAGGWLARRLLAEFVTLGARISPIIREPEERGKEREGGNGDKCNGAAALTNLFFRDTFLYRRMN